MRVIVRRLPGIIMVIAITIMGRLRRRLGLRVRGRGLEGGTMSIAICPSRRGMILRHIGDLAFWRSVEMKDGGGIF